MPRVAEEAGVFAGFRGKRQIAELNDKGFDGIRARSKPRHTMRDTMATGMAAGGVDIDDVSHVLNHSIGLRIAPGYNAYAYDREKQIALGAWDREIARILAREEKARASVESPR